MDNASRFTLFSKKLSVLIGIMFTHAHKRVCWLKSLPIVFHVSPLLFQFLSIMATVCEAKRGDCALQWCRAHWQHGNIHAHVLSLHAFSSSARWCLSGGMFYAETAALHYHFLCPTVLYLANHRVLLVFYSLSVIIP